MSEENKNENIESEVEVIDNTTGESHDVQEITNNEETSNERPEWLPEKFKSAEDMAKAYSELEKKMSSGKTKEEDSTNEEENKTENTETETNNESNSEEETKTEDKVEVDLSDVNLENKVNNIAKKLQDSGMDTQKIFEELRNDGKLSDNTLELYKEKFGNDAKDVLEDTLFISEVAEKYQAKQEEELYSVVGDKESYETLVNYFSNNMNDYAEEINDFNDAFNSGDAKSMKLALKVLKNTYENTNGSINNRTVSSTSKVSGQISGDVFNSQAEYNAEMGKNYSKYQSDAAYRNELDAKLERSMKFWK